MSMVQNSIESKEGQTQAVCWHCDGTSACGCFACRPGGPGGGNQGKCFVCSRVAEVAATETASDRLRGIRRQQLRGWEIKTAADLERVFSQAEEVQLPRGPVLRWKDGEDAEVVEHEVDVEAETGLEPDPYWTELGERGKGAQLLFDAGLKKKAFRYADCETRGEKATCKSFPDKHRFIKRYHCMNRFCKYCGPVHRARLHAHYEPLLVAYLRDQDHPPGYTLARLDFTLRCDGEVPTSEQVRAFNEAVRRTVRRSVCEILRLRAASGDDWAASVLKSRKAAYGILFSDEVGYETRGHLPDNLRVAHGLNLHTHGLLLAPFLPDWRAGWEVFRDTWQEESLRAFGEESHGCYIVHLRPWRSDPVPAIKSALNHLLKYISKCPYETMQRMVELEKCFEGARRVHAGGVWHGLKEPKAGRGSGYCPICKKEGRDSPLHLHRRLLPNGGEIPDYWPVKVLQDEGWRDLEEVRRELGFSDSDGGGP